MAPTETLAEQHFRTLDSLLGADGPVPFALLTGATPAPERKAHLQRLASGEPCLTVGTHALIQPDVEFGELTVAVVDEQHRFGVGQRAALDAKGPGGLAPHALHMTATPIPRTLSLTAYGDLDTTAIRELPRGRQADPHLGRRRAEARGRLRLHPGSPARGAPGLRRLPARQRVGGDGGEGRRGRGGAAGDRRAGGLQGRACCTGRCPPRTRARRCGASPRGEIDVLVATSVIEVGVDVPNATVMLVESRRALRALAAPPAPRPGREGRARVVLHPLRRRPGEGPERGGEAAARGDRLGPRRLRARRGRPRRSAARASCSAPASTACRDSARRCSPTTPRCCSRPATRSAACSSATAPSRTRRSGR